MVSQIACRSVRQTFQSETCIPMTFEVKCAGCGEYFLLSRVVKEGNGYYCKKCYKNFQKEQQRESLHQATCIFCNKVLHDGDWNTHSGYRYCNDCLKAIAGKNENSRTYKCSVCGEMIDPGEARMVRDGKEFCEKCYHQVFDEVKSEKKYKCSVCGKEMGIKEVKMRAGQNYCTRCYLKAEDYLESAVKKFFAREENRSKEGTEKFIELRTKGDNIDLAREIFDEKEAKKPETVYADTAGLFKCLGDPCRVKIVESLADHNLSVFAFVEMTGYQYSAISYHLKMLKDMGLVYSFRDGNFQVYSLTNKGAAVHEFIKKSTELQ